MVIHNIGSKGPLFILAGNGPYDNRGCEAIVRGTVEILRNYFDDPQFLIVSNFSSKAQFEAQRVGEKDSAIIHERSITPHKKFGPLRFLRYGLTVLCPRLRPYLSYKRILPYLVQGAAVLSIGGDNYSLDYGIPHLYTDLGNLALSKKKPTVIWGASVGPFSAMPKYEAYMAKYLKRVSGIFAREQSTIEYLARIGVTRNVYRVADPAFLMKPVMPAKERLKTEIREGAIGINVSPLMAKYTTNGNLDEWSHLAADIVKSISARIKLPIYLIPHVTVLESNDYVFSKRIMAELGGCNEKIHLITCNLNAAETKWVISKMAVFAGARTHSTIAALSSGIPTLSFGYSMKARGINRDIYGHDQYCLEPQELFPNTVAKKVEELIRYRNNVEKQIDAALPRIKNLAMNAGKYLKDIIGDL